MIENHVDAWNYKNGGFNPHEIAAPCPKDPWAATEDYPDISMSADDKVTGVDIQSYDELEK